MKLTRYESLSYIYLSIFLNLQFDINMIEIGFVYK